MRVKALACLLSILSVAYIATALESRRELQVGSVVNTVTAPVGTAVEAVQNTTQAATQVARQGVNVIGNAVTTTAPVALQIIAWYSPTVGLAMWGIQSGAAQRVINRTNGALDEAGNVIGDVALGLAGLTSQVGNEFGDVKGNVTERMRQFTNVTRTQLLNAGDELEADLTQLLEGAAWLTDGIWLWRLNGILDNMTDVGRLVLMDAADSALSSALAIQAAAVAQFPDWQFDAFNRTWLLFQNASQVMDADEALAHGLLAIGKGLQLIANSTQRIMQDRASDLEVLLNSLWTATGNASEVLLNNVARLDGISMPLASALQQEIIGLQAPPALSAAGRRLQSVCQVDWLNVDPLALPSLECDWEGLLPAMQDLLDTLLMPVQTFASWLKGLWDESVTTNCVFEDSVSSVLYNMTEPFSFRACVDWGCQQCVQVPAAEAGAPIQYGPCNVTAQENATFIARQTEQRRRDRARREGPFESVQLQLAESPELCVSVAESKQVQLARCDDNDASAEWAVLQLQSVFRDSDRFVLQQSSGCWTWLDDGSGAALQECNCGAQQTFSVNSNMLLNRLLA